MDSRKFRIDVTINDSASRTECSSGTKINGIDTYNVTIAGDRKIYDADVKTAIFHEVGHALGFALKYPMHKEAVQGLFPFWERDDKKLVKMELEAWRNAEKLFKRVKKLSLKAYRGK